MADFNPSSGFDPTQYLNQYSNFNMGALPGTAYSGLPVNAGTGTPVSGYVPPPPPAPIPPAAAVPGTTINKPPVMIPDYQAYNAALSGGRGGNAAEQQITYNPLTHTPSPAASPAAPAGVMSSANPYGSAASQAYLQALARPDKVVTPGIPGINATYQPDSAGIMNIINQMAQLQGSGQNQPPPDPNATGRGTSAITGYTGNSGFLNALAALRGAPGAAPAAKG